MPSRLRQAGSGSALAAPSAAAGSGISAAGSGLALHARAARLMISAACEARRARNAAHPDLWVARNIYDSNRMGIDL